MYTHLNRMQNKNKNIQRYSLIPFEMWNYCNINTQWLHNQTFTSARSNLIAEQRSLKEGTHSDTKKPPNCYTCVNKSHMTLPLGILGAQMDQTMHEKQWTASFHFKGSFHQEWEFTSFFFALSVHILQRDYILLSLPPRATSWMEFHLRCTQHWKTTVSSSHSV